MDDRVYYNLGRPSAPQLSNSETNLTNPDIPPASAYLAWLEAYFANSFRPDDRIQAQWLYVRKTGLGVPQDSFIRSITCGQKSVIGHRKDGRLTRGTMCDAWPPFPVERSSIENPPFKTESDTPRGGLKEQS